MQCIISAESLAMLKGKTGKWVISMLDFDGVICDSCGETAISALKVHACSLTLSLLPLVTMKMEENSRK